MDQFGNVRCKNTHNSIEIKIEFLFFFRSSYFFFGLEKNHISNLPYLAIMLVCFWLCSSAKKRGRELLKNPISPKNVFFLRVSPPPSSIEEILEFQLASTSVSCARLSPLPPFTATKLSPKLVKKKKRRIRHLLACVCERDKELLGTRREFRIP